MIGEIQTKLFDLLPVIRRNVYHPAFAGSYSLKQVLPALLPEMTYAGTQIANGEEAGLAWQQMIARGMANAVRQRLRSALLEYCQRDTAALVKLIEKLRGNL
jgi:hypothetical protein